MQDNLTIKQHRLIKGMTQLDMATALGVAKPTYSRIEKDIEKETVSEVKAICKILNISIEQVFFAQ